MRAELAWHDLESNRFGTDGFLKYCEPIGAEPYICINAGLGTIEDARHWVEEIYNFEDALAMGLFFNSFFRHADVVKMANLAQLVNVIAPIITNKQGLFLQPIYFPIVEYGKQRGNVALHAWVASPTYTANQQPLPYLDVSATYNAPDHTVYVNVLNRSKSQEISTHAYPGRRGHVEAGCRGLANELSGSEGDAHVRRRQEGGS